jgi:murein L,D-transpeptidase YcbB/YkuD
LSPRSSGSSTTYPPAKDTDGYTRPKQNSSKTIVYKLGDRVLKKGMKGHDVTELLNILVVKRYIVPKEGTPVIATGEYEFTSLIENAVKDFQKGNNLEVDGIVGVTTIYYLKKQND